MGKIALVAGGTGLVGGHLVRQLCAHPSYDKVIALGRSKPTADWASHNKVELMLIDFDDLAQQLESIKLDEVYCALGTTAKKTPSKAMYEKIDKQYPIDLANAGLIAGASFFGMVSALGAKEGSPSKYSHYKGTVENFLKQSAYQHVAIAQPSLLLGEREEFRLGESLFSLVTPLMPKVIKSVYGKDVAGALVSEANTDQQGVVVLPNKLLHGKALNSI
jgi:uncharacterized protein YbjT (DUF2867 family)